MIKLKNILNEAKVKGAIDKDSIQHLALDYLKGTNLLSKISRKAFQNWLKTLKNSYTNKEAAESIMNLVKDAGLLPKVSKSKHQKWMKDMLGEGKLNEAQTKIFDQGSLNDIEKQIRKLVGIPKDDGMMNQSVEYDEHRFTDGTGGFRFTWHHSKSRWGQLGLSLMKNGNHYLYAKSAYSGKKFGKEKIKPKFMGNVKTWKDLDNMTMQTIVTVLKPLVKKNEKSAEKAFEQERKGQQAHYGEKNKTRTGRIGYGL